MVMASAGGAGRGRSRMPFHQSFSASQWMPPIGLAAQQMLLRWPWSALSGLDPLVQANLVALNAMSVGALLAVLVVSLAGLLRDYAVADGRGTRP